MLTELLDVNYDIFYGRKITALPIVGVYGVSVNGNLEYFVMPFN